MVYGFLIQQVQEHIYLVRLGERKNTIVTLINEKLGK
jgi:hypothetical protein